ncbi:MAG TPA: hypothetical protein VF508_06220, partial [Pyrinomonadaceae bacterium]
DARPAQLSPVTSTLLLAKKDLFNFSAKGGVCQLLAREDGVQVPPKFKVAENCTSVDDVKAVTVTVFNVDGTKPMDQVIAEKYVRDPKDKGDRGFYYRIPRRTFVRLFVGDISAETNERARKEFMVAQLGITASIPSKVGGRKTKYELAMFESSGALKNFTMGSDALVGKAQVEEVTGAVTTAIDAKTKRKQAETDAEIESQDELKRLKREREILEEQEKIDALKKKRDQQPPTQ